MITVGKGEYSWLANDSGLQGNLSVDHIYNAVRLKSKGAASRVITQEHPCQATQLSKQYEQKEHWPQISDRAMLSMLQFKFGPCFPDLMQKLDETGDEVIEERATDYPGLGKLLMLVREKNRLERTSSPKRNRTRTQESIN